MKSLIFLLIIINVVNSSPGKIVCYWNGQSYWKSGSSKVTIEEIKPALSYCTHLIYGFAAINDDDYHIEPIDKKLDLDLGIGQYKVVTNLKQSFPSLTIMLGLGGNEDIEDLDKYFDVLEKSERRTKFINSIASFLREFKFDGIDLAWEFPQQHEKATKRSWSSIWHKVKKTLGFGVDSNAAEHRTQFTSLVRDLRTVLQTDGKVFSIGVLPHVNSSVYYDIKTIMQYVDFVNLWTFDYRSPERSSDIADFSAPIYYQYDRVLHQNVEATVDYWLQNGASGHQIIMGIPTFGRAWKLTTDSSISGAPPIAADGSCTESDSGLMAYNEICPKLVSPILSNVPKDSLRRVADATKRFGTYAYLLPNKSTGVDKGCWVSFEDPETAAYKTMYARRKGLAGVAVIELSSDDFRGSCEGTKYPILRTIKHNIGETNLQQPFNSRTF